MFKRLGPHLNNKRHEFQLSKEQWLICQKLSHKNLNLTQNGSDLDMTLITNIYTGYMNLLHNTLKGIKKWNEFPTYKLQPTHMQKPVIWIIAKAVRARRLWWTSFPMY